MCDGQKRRRAKGYKLGLGMNAEAMLLMITRQLYLLEPKTKIIYVFSRTRNS
jgi:hypothetical protein